MKKNYKKYLIQILIATLVIVSVVAGLYEKNKNALAINLNGESLGIVKDLNTIKLAEEKANELLKSDKPLGFFKCNFKTTKTFDSVNLDVDTLAKMILEKGTVYTNAWIVTISGKAVAALYDRDEALDSLSNFKQSFLDEKNRIIKSIDFMSNVDINYGEIDINLIKTKDELLQLMKKSIERTQISHYKKDGLTAYKDYKDLYLSRDNLSFDVFTKDELEEKIHLPASTIFKYDESLAIGETKIERQGEDGILYRKSENEYINDQIIKTTVINEKLLSYPTSTIMLVGDRALTLRPQFQMPTYGIITSGFGPRFDGFHRGIDIAGPFGSEIKASAPGEVTFAGFLGSYGYVVFVQHANGYETRYAHMLRIIANKGDRVNTGDVLGEMGSSGNSTGAHLHFEILKDGQLLNPENEL